MGGPPPSVFVFRPDSSHQPLDTYHSFPRLRPPAHLRTDIVRRVNFRDQLRKKRSGGDRHLDRPEKMNAMGQDFWFGMPPVFDRINEDMNVRAVVLAARGKAFSVGLDFDMIPRPVWAPQT